MEYNRAQFKCASTIAFFEGRSLLDLPGNIISASTLQALDIRMRRIESAWKIGLAPACQLATWETLAHRIFRVLKSYPSPFHQKLAPSDFLQFVSDPGNVSSETLQILCSDLGYQGFEWSKPVEFATPLDELAVYGQICCYYLGKSKMQATQLPMTRSEIYASLVYLSVSNEPCAYAPIMTPFARRQQTNVGSLVPDGVTVVNAAPRRRRRKCSKLLKFSWVKTLACWRNRHDDDDSSVYSSSSSSSSTLGD